MEQDLSEISLVAGKIIHMLSGTRFPLNAEKDLQSAIESWFRTNHVDHIREHRLDPKNILDFYINGIAIEVKIRGSSMEIYRQCARYCKFDQVKSMILVTNRSMGFPKEINGKPCYVLNLGKAWL